MAGISALLIHPRPGSIIRRSAMQIKKHDRSHMVELRDGSAWRIWPGDIPKTLQWLPTTEIDVADIDDEICSHALINRSSSRSPQAQELVRLSLVGQFERRPLRRRKIVCLAEPSPIDRNVLPLDIAGLAEGRAKRGNLERRINCRPAAEEPKHRHRLLPRGVSISI